MSVIKFNLNNSNFQFFGEPFQSNSSSWCVHCALQKVQLPQVMCSPRNELILSLQDKNSQTI